ncbi:hypothetical protein B0H11DRAFT_2254140 [Mycena galericulata]|nr:hypothetical protein B0H11DRAFT_2254140 [Mycena galericulata]
MAPKTWHDATQRAFFETQMPDFIRRRGEGKLYKFWGPMFAAWFHLFPEQAALGYPVPGTPRAPKLTEEQLAILGNAMVARKKLENYFRNNCAKVRSGPSAKHEKSVNSLARALFKAKPTRQRVHKPIEVFQMRNKTQIREELTHEGHDSLNEESMAPAVDNWVDEADSVQVSRIKDAAAKRMRLRTKVVKALFAEANDDELAAIAAIIEQEKAGDVVLGDDKDGQPLRTPAELQAYAHFFSVAFDFDLDIALWLRSIDESWDVVKLVHSIIEKKTGWYGFTVWGGPNPRLGGELSMKIVSFGLSPNGFDFEAAHASFDEAISVPFQEFLKRCFPAEIRHERALDPASIPAAKEPLDPAFRLAGDAVSTGEAPEAPNKPKRMKKPKKSTQPKPAPAGSPAVPTLTPAVLPTVSQPASGVPAVPGIPAVNSFATSPVATAVISTEETPSIDSSSNNLTLMFPDDEHMYTAMESMNCDEYGMPPLPPASPASPAFSWLQLPPSSSPWNSPSPASEPLPQTTSFAAPSQLYSFPTPADRILLHEAALANPRDTTPLATSSTAGGTSGEDVSRVNGLFAEFRRHVDSSPARTHSIFGTAGNLPPAPLWPGLTGAQVAPVAAGNDATPVAMVPAPSYPRSRPMANEPPKAKAEAGKRRGRPPKAKVADGKGVGAKEMPAREAAAKEAGKKKSAGARRGVEGDVSVDTATDVAAAGPLVDKSNATPAAPMLIYSSTNNNRAQLKAIKAREAKEAVEARALARRTFNPDGETPLIIVPAPRPERARKLTMNADGSMAKFSKVRTRAEMAQERNAKSENALLARSAVGKAAASKKGPSKAVATKAATAATKATKAATKAATRAKKALKLRSWASNR